MRIILSSILLAGALSAADLPPGHSIHGESFNEGPRRRMPQIQGCGTVSFPVSSSVPEVQGWINQGVGQMHGFWYWEAERSFRTALALDPNCAMAHWGMAMANLENESRARGFLAKITSEATERLTPRERAYVEATRKLFAEVKGNEARDERAREFIRNLEVIALDYPDDLEARAAIVGFAWRHDTKYGLKITSTLALHALADQVLTKQPQHPAHHYLIHLWDKAGAVRGLHAAAMSGPSAPGCAHMWHMPGHIYSALYRWTDASWQQEAAARVDHAQMARSRVFPDQIHNYAHNSEWLVRTYNHQGRLAEALTVALNLMEMPKIPRSSKADEAFAEDGTAWHYGFQRLTETLLRWELWEVVAELESTPYLEASTSFSSRWKLAQLRALAAYGRGDRTAAQSHTTALQGIEAEQRQQRVTLADAAEKTARAAKKNPDEINQAMAAAMLPITKNLDQLTAPLAELAIRELLADGKRDAAKTALAELKTIPEHRMVLLHRAVGDFPKAVELAKAYAEGHANQLQPHALYADTQWEAGQKDEAVATFRKLQPWTGWADRKARLWDRLQPVIAAAGVAGDWRVPETIPHDLGARPPLDSLGPLRWSPWKAPAWTALTKEGAAYASENLQGKPHVLIAFLGNACAHCNEQVKAFAACAEKFAKAGIPIIALSSDDVAGVAATPSPPPFPIYAAADFAAFKALDAWDDFENKPLHATCLIDGSAATAPLQSNGLTLGPQLNHVLRLRIVSRSFDGDDLWGRVPGVESAVFNDVRFAGWQALRPVTHRLCFLGPARMPSVKHDDDDAPGAQQAQRGPQRHHGRLGARDD
jgi:peroxiredoxin